MTATANGSATEREIALPPDAEVLVSLDSGSLRVTGTTGDLVRIRSTDGSPLDERVRIEASDTGITVRPVGADLALGPLRIIRGASAELEIEVPRRARLAVRTASADIEASDIGPDSRWATASGDVAVELAGGRLRVDAVSGTVEVDATGPLRLHGRSVSGDVQVRAPRLDALRVTTTSGDVVVRGEFGEGEHEVQTVSGDVEIVTASPLRIDTQTVAGDVDADVPHRVEGRRARGTLVVGAGTIPLRWRSMSGDLFVRGDEPDRAGAVRSTGEPARRAPAEPPMPEPAEPPARPATAPDDAPPSRPRARTEMQEDARLEVLRAVERGELSIEEAAVRLDALDEPGPLSRPGWV